MEFKILKTYNKNGNEDEYNLIDDETDDEETDQEKTDNEKFIDIKQNDRTDIKTTKLVECGIVFQGERACVLSRVLHMCDDSFL